MRPGPGRVLQRWNPTPPMASSTTTPATIRIRFIKARSNTMVEGPDETVRIVHCQGDAGGHHSLTVVAPIGAARVSKRFCERHEIDGDRRQRKHAATNCGCHVQGLSYDKPVRLRHPTKYWLYRVPPHRPPAPSSLPSSAASTFAFTVRLSSPRRRAVSS